MSLLDDIEDMFDRLLTQAGRAGQCLTFWVLLGLVYWHHDSRIESLNERRVQAWESVNQARNRLANFPRYARNICADGIVSGSMGSGTCSHHGGIKESVMFVQSVAKQDPDRTFQSRETRATVFSFVLALVSLFVAPGLHEVLFKKHDISGEDEA